MRPNELPDEPPTDSIRSFRAHMAARIDGGKVIAITRSGKKVGYWVPVNEPFPVEPDEIDPDDEVRPEEDGGDGPIVMAQIGPSDGPRLNVVWTSALRLSLPEFLGEEH